MSYYVKEDVKMLDGAGYTVSVAENGEASLDIMSREHIDLVVLDVMMPELFLTARTEVYQRVEGLDAGAAWLCYYYAISRGDVSVVVPIDKLSVLITVAFSFIVFKEKLSKKAFFGLSLMVTGTLLMAFFK